MFAMILMTTWRWTRTSVLALSVLAFGLPALAWAASRAAASAGAVMRVGDFVEFFLPLGVALALVAVLGGFLVAVQPYTVEAESRHVYALSLPVTWSRYVAMRWAAGAVTLLLPALALYLGSLLALSAVEVPDALHTYPGALAARFLLALLVSYALGFALQYVTGRYASRVLLGALVMVLALVVGGDFVGLGGPVRRTVTALFSWPSPLAIYTDWWSLIDV